MYTIQVPHSGLHLLAAALEIAKAARAYDFAAFQRHAEIFRRFAENRESQLLETERAVFAAHIEAVKVDGHGDEIVSDGPMVGDALRELEESASAQFTEYELQIAAAKVGRQSN